MNNVMRSVVVVGVVAMTKLLCTTAVSAAPSAIDELGNVQIFNCGYNTTAFVLEYFQRKVDPSHLAEELKTGTCRSNPVSMLEMKNALQAAHLNVAAYRNVSRADLFKALEQHMLCVVHVDIPVPSHVVGHYYVLAGIGKPGIYVINAGVGEKWVSLHDFDGGIAHRMSGYCLFISEARTDKEEAAHVDLSKKEQYISTAARPLESEVSVKLLLSNSTAKTLVVNHASGSCSCFKTMRPEIVRVVPGGTANVDLVFDARTFGTGHVQKRVALHFADLTVEPLVLVLDVEVPQVPRSRTVSWFPMKVDYGRATANEIARPQRITLILPASESLTKYTASSDKMQLRLVSDDVSDDEEGEARVYQFTLRVVHPFVGPFDENVEFHTTDAHATAVTVSVRGEVADDLVASGK